ncbi:uncharacterized protein LOC127286102 [Leptopilina boulardi]|uniref:uncharacterized protein LOC127286102 n=1 Tax=Leptopilina boulardi TaxID=63433 RepID=UPI0021F64A2D|nr:uncharacterized protein LOC127286102 [Leptopilina boulardi]
MALLFSTDKLISELNRQTEVYMDGTFEVCPKIAKICQLYTIVMRVNDKSVGAVFILMTRRTKLLYKAVLIKIQELCPNLKNNLEHSMLDFESAVQTAIKELFPNCQIHGCWFHSKKAMKKRWKTLKLKEADNIILNYACCLALAPAERYYDGLEIIKNKIYEYNRVYHPKLKKFIKYLKQYWGRRKAILCVGHLPHRTNNLCESQNSRLQSKLGGSHPQIWNFTGV